jgi:5-oxopent-3-ene-1,2,5-tricarboxylate decarboxylase / 2-hydroxyhepta-2,4-diene-1,7-dioate isomerase
MAMIAGTVYGVALNDREQHKRLAIAFEGPPYGKPPQRPVLYIKPRNCVAGNASRIPLSLDLTQVEIAATLGLLIGRDASRVTPEAAFDHIAGVCLALDIAEPHDSYYRPPVRQRCRDGFLPLGAPAAFDSSLLDGNIETFVNDLTAHIWSPRRLLRGAASLIADISAFMTLAAGDLLLIGVPYDAPRAGAGDRIIVRAKRLPELSAQLHAEITA